MRIFGVSSSYDCLGASLLSDAAHYVGAFLIPVTPGTLVIEASSTHRTEAPVKPSLELLAERFAAEWERLPLLRYRRKAETIVLSFASQLPAEVVFRREDDGYNSAFPVILGELLHALGDAFSRSRTVRDAIDMTAFQAALERASEKIPTTESTRAALLKRIWAERAAERALPKTLDRLGVDWSRFHPSARQTLDDPLYWDEGAGVAPHGNDTGADVLAAYRRWRPRHRADSAYQFLVGIWSEWWPEDEIAADAGIETLWTDAEVALAFAQLKVDGRCDPDVAGHAIDAIARKLKDSGHTGDDHEKLRRMRAKLVAEAH